ncbi:hypothetical protein EV363DRAFT_1419265 [Boletus edulis]|nr:hypothetical protein EV363DRAFT_1419265 [Boletus edulis]
MSSYTRTLTFRTQDLGTDATLMLIFDKASDGSYDKFPVVWKVSMFAASGRSLLNTGFQPVLRAYITSAYEFEEGQIIKDQIPTPFIFEQDLSSLEDITIWNLRYDFRIDRFSIVRV